MMAPRGLQDAPSSRYLLHFARVAVLGWAGGDSRSVNNYDAKSRTQRDGPDGLGELPGWIEQPVRELLLKRTHEKGPHVLHVGTLFRGDVV